MTQPIELYKQALDKWGIDFQIDMLIEECSELIKALCKYKRFRKPELIVDIAEELIDVEIMIKQVEIFVNRKDVRIPSLTYSIYDNKLKRLEGLLNEK